MAQAGDAKLRAPGGLCLMRNVAIQHVADADLPPPRTAEELRERLKGARGLWKDRGTTDEFMKLTRGED